MKYCFIINPKAGKGKLVEGVKNDIEKVCNSNGAKYEIFLSERIEDTHDYIRRKTESESGKLNFVACGGDGTLCETILSVMDLPDERRSEVSVGVIPMGTGNDFASNFSDREKFFDIEAQLSSAPYEIDLVKCNDMYSVNMVNVGFDSHVVCTKEKICKKKWVPRKMAYIFALLLTLIKKPGLSVDICCDGKEIGHKELLLTTLANGSFCGGGFHSNPLASLTDGKIDVLSAKNMGRIKFLSLVGDYKKGSHLGEKFKNIIENFKCSTAELRFSKETPVSIDGEIVRTKEIHLSVEKKALRLMLPSGIMPKVRQIGEKIGQKIEKAVDKISEGISSEKAEV